MLTILARYFHLDLGRAADYSRVHNEMRCVQCDAAKQVGDALPHIVLWVAQAGEQLGDDSWHGHE